MTAADWQLSQDHVDDRALSTTKSPRQIPPQRSHVSRQLASTFLPPAGPPEPPFPNSRYSPDMLPHARRPSPRLAQSAALQAPDLSLLRSRSHTALPDCAA